jgi:uncharacterized protein (DUF4415 family)
MAVAGNILLRQILRAPLEYSVNVFYALKAKNMVTVRIFQVVFNKFKAAGMRTSGNCAEKLRSY